MNNELFPIEQVQMDSPRLRWMKKHGIIVWKHPGFEEGPVWFIGFQKWWPKLSGADFFCTELGQYGDSRLVEAESEEEAFATFARYFKIPLWNEENK